MKKIMAVAFMSAVLLSGCVTDKLSRGVIKVNDVVITNAEFNRALDKNIDNSFYKAFGGSANFVKNDTNPGYLTLKEQTIQELIAKALLDSEVKKRGIKVTENDIENEKKAIIDKVGSKEQLQSLLKSRNVSNDEFIEDLKTQIRMKKLVDSIEKINISDNDAKKYYDSHRAEFKHPEMVRASHILISSDTIKMIQEIKAADKNITPEKMNQKLEEMQAQKKAKAEEVLKRVNANPADFEKIASEVSEDLGSKERGGQLGFFSREQMVPEFSKTAFAMKPNTISGLVKTPYGYHIIKVTDRVEAGIRPYEKIKDELKFVLETEAQVKVISNLISGLRKTADVKYLDKSFDSKEIMAKLNKALNDSKKAKEENK